VALTKKFISEKKRVLWKRILAHKALYLFLAPTLIYLAIFAYGPMYGVQIAFKNYNPVLGIWKSKWAGLRNIRQFTNAYNFWQIIRNTLTISLYSGL
jgi:putative aldouronate transport system permease protein